MTETSKSVDAEITSVATSRKRSIEESSLVDGAKREEITIEDNERKNVDSAGLNNNSEIPKSSDEANNLEPESKSVDEEQKASTSYKKTSKDNKEIEEKSCWKSSKKRRSTDDIEDEIFGPYYWKRCWYGPVGLNRILKYFEKQEEEAKEAKKKYFG